MDNANQYTMNLLTRERDLKLDYIEELKEDMDLLGCSNIGELVASEIMQIAEAELTQIEAYIKELS
jgi:hypothetical protein